MQLPKELGLGAAWLFMCIFSSLAQDIDTSFDVQGSCTPEQRELLNQFVIETLELVDTARQGIENVHDDEIMQLNLRTYLGAKQTPTNRDTKTVDNLVPRGEIQSLNLLTAKANVQTDLTNAYFIEMLRDVRSFLIGALPAFGDNGSGKPRLYCSSKWWQQKQPGDAAQDADGQPIPDRTIRDENGKSLGTIKGKQQYAYWTDDYNAYTFGDDTEGEFYCDDEDNLALTDDSPGIRPIALIMCPSSFKIQPGTNLPRTTILGDKRPQAGQEVNEFQPRTLTFFHEVIHVVRGVKATTRFGKVPLEYYSYPDIITFAGKDPAGSRKNPDNYAFFTLSYWYWQKRQYSRDDDSGDLAADAQPGIKYHFADGTAIEKVIKG
ncbi:MAG: hypothetical protein Q9204_002447 [Flavoplaca sp. TL-2023a]